MTKDNLKPRNEGGPKTAGINQLRDEPGDSIPPGLSAFLPYAFALADSCSRLFMVLTW